MKWQVIHWEKKYIYTPDKTICVFSEYAKNFFYIIYKIAQFSKWSKKLKQADEYARIINKHLKRCSASLIIREMQIKAMKWNHFTPTRMAKVKKTNNTKGWQGYEATGTFMHCWSKCKMYFGNSLVIFRIVEHKATVQCTKTTVRYLTKRNKNINYNESYLNVRISQKQEKNKQKTSINRWLD